VVFEKNNLSDSLSPYLRQHADNPVWWQEWNEETLTHARESGKPMLVSVGYATCHWCHVMAADAFSNSECARFLNENFVSIKIDREQRPDIDHYLMTFLVSTTGSGGWPLNAFLTPDGHPFFAMTYAASEPRFNLPGFREILGRVIEFYSENAAKIEAFTLPDDQSRTSSGLAGKRADEPFVVPIRDEDATATLDLIKRVATQYDSTNAGFGSGAKFPPHSPLLFLHHATAAGFREAAGPMVERTLDTMQQRGLHDHLQGGFFRYTVDKSWTIPHFEKMLYDQALLLWNYSIASRLFSREEYKATAAGIFRCLEETFLVDGLYASGHDADTDHKEGETYLWTLAELRSACSDSEFSTLEDLFDLSEPGNFEGKNHLIMKGEAYTPLPEALREKLIALRRKRPQPDRDEKLIVSWNALAAIALFAADRFAGIPGAGARAVEITRTLLDRYEEDGAVFHGSFDGIRDNNRFLGDHAALLLLVTYAREHSEQLFSSLAPVENRVAVRLSDFQKQNTWFENITADFSPIPADPYDQPIPSSISLAEFALLRRSMAGHREYEPLQFRRAHGQAFANIAALASMGYYWVVEAPEHYDWTTLPPNAITTLGEHRMSCYRGVCYLGPPPADVQEKEQGSGPQT
jgi:uncharacterized protein YyaL (SSP411 family)